MHNISNLKIGARLALGFCLVLFCALAMLALGLWRMSELRNGTELIVNGKVAGLSHARDMRDAGWSVALSLRKIATPTDEKEAARESTKLAQILNGYAKSEAALKTLVAGTPGSTA